MIDIGVLYFTYSIDALFFAFMNFTLTVENLTNPGLLFPIGFKGGQEFSHVDGEVVSAILLGIGSALVFPLVLGLAFPLVSGTLMVFNSGFFLACAAEWLFLSISSLGFPFSTT